MPQPISTVTIDYEFQIQLLGDVENEEEYVEELLHKLQSQLGESLGKYMKSNTQDGEDETSCRGYYVEDSWRRKLNKRRARAEGEDLPTRIIAIESSRDMSIDKDVHCIPKNDGCHVIWGEYDATYVGFNEPGVKSSVSRAIKVEMDEGRGDSGDDYQLSFLGLQGELTRSPEPGISRINVVDYMEEMVEKSIFTSYGIGFIVALGSAFLMVMYIFFVKSDATDKVKDRIDERKEKKKDKKTALGERDKERETPEDQSYCYDLESVAIVEEGHLDYESEGVEVRSNHSGSLAASVASPDSGRTRKMSNMTGNINYTAAQRLDSLLVDDAEFCHEETSCTPSAASAPRPNAVSPLDAGCSIGTRNRSGGSGSGNSGRTNGREVSHGTLGSNYDESNSRGPPADSYMPFNGLLSIFSASDGGDNGNNRSLSMVDRTPSFVRTSTRGSSASTDQSPASACSTIVQQLPSISEAELPPPMNDTPLVNKSRSRASFPRSNASPEKAPLYEECEV